MQADRPAFVDTHVHFHDLRHPTLRYKWIEWNDSDDVDWAAPPEGPIRSQRYWADDFLAETRFQNVRKVVHVQVAVGTDDPVEETKWVQAFSDRLGVPHGIIAETDLAAPDAAHQLDRHAAFANFRGVRHLRPPGYWSDPAWLRGYEELARRRLIYCDATPVAEMAVAAEVSARFSDATLCIDHAGFPKARDQAYFEAWRSGMRALARSESTVVKISGLGQCDHGWTVDSLRPWVLECIDAWGVERSFFGSNWPNDRRHSSYGDVVDAYAEIIADFTADEQHALFSGNAERIFRLEG